MLAVLEHDRQHEQPEERQPLLVLVPVERPDPAEVEQAEGQRDGESFRPGGLDVLAQHVMARACAGPFEGESLRLEVVSSSAYAWVDQAVWERVLQFVATGGYALRAYDRFQRIVLGRDGLWRLTHPEHAARHQRDFTEFFRKQRSPNLQYEFQLALQGIRARADRLTQRFQQRHPRLRYRRQPVKPALHTGDIAVPRNSAREGCRVM